MDERDASTWVAQDGRYRRASRRLDWRSMHCPADRNVSVVCGVFKRQVIVESIGRDDCGGIRAAGPFRTRCYAFGRTRPDHACHLQHGGEGLPDIRHPPSRRAGCRTGVGSQPFSAGRTGALARTIPVSVRLLRRRRPDYCRNPGCRSRRQHLGRVPASPNWRHGPVSCNASVDVRDTAESGG